MTLLKGNFRTESINNGSTALARLDDVTPALIVLDLALPSLLGTDIIMIVRGNDRFANTRVIVATSDSQMADKAVLDMADLVLTKPVGYKELRDFAEGLMM